MRLNEIMTSPVETIQASAAADQAWNRMRSSRIHHLVVLDGSDVVGVLSDRDLGSARGSQLRKGRTAGDLMASPIVTAQAQTTVREAANKLRGRGIGCLPIMDQQRLVGIITVSDLLALLGKGVERPVATRERHVLARRGPRQRPLAIGRAR